MTWTYSIEWHTGGGSATRSADGGTRKSIVVISSKLRSSKESDLITVDVWTQESEEIPIAVFAQVRKGGQPVLGARVSVSVEIERKKAGNLKLDPVILEDKGNGGEFNSFD